MKEDEIFVNQTKAWIESVVIGCNFCPFAAREVLKGTVDYQVVQNASQKEAVTVLLSLCKKLDEDKTIETTLLILPHAFIAFTTFMQLVKAAERTLGKKDHNGTYQVATFHPDYVFGDAPADDAANYTNRSPYPMLQLLREKSISRAVASYGHPESIPKHNIAFARENGSAQMQALLNECFKIA